MQNAKAPRFPWAGKVIEDGNETLRMQLLRPESFMIDDDNYVHTIVVDRVTTETIHKMVTNDDGSTVSKKTTISMEERYRVTLRGIKNGDDSIVGGTHPNNYGPSEATRLRRLRDRLHEIAVDWAIDCTA